MQLLKLSKNVSQWGISAFSIIMVFSWTNANHYSPWLAFHADWIAAFALTVLSLALVFKKKNYISYSVSLILIIAIIPIIQYAVGIIYFSGDAWMASLYLVGLAIAIWCGLNSEGNKENVADIICIAIIFAAIISAGIALTQWLNLPALGIYSSPMQPGGRPYGNFAQPNQQATFLGMGIVSVIYLYERNKLNLTTLALASCYLFFGMALTQSRAAWLEMTLLVTWLFLINQRCHIRLGKTHILFLFFLFFLLVVSLPSFSDFLGVSSRNSPLSSGTRPIHWATVVEAIFQRPLTGYGWNQVSVGVAYTAHLFPASYEMIEHSHNIILDVLVWNGIPLGITILLIVIIWFSRAMLRCSDGATAALIGIVIIPVAHAMVEFPLEYAYFLIPVGVIFGIVEKRQGQECRWPISRSLSIPVVGCTLVLFIFVSYEYMEVENNTRLLRFESKKIGGHTAISATPRIHILTQQREFLRFARSQAKERMSASELDWMRKISERYGYPPVLFRYALASGLNQQPSNAKAALVRLCKIHSEAVCAEMRDNWKIMQKKYPVLLDIQP